MNQFKQYIWVVSILFFSLISAVALCYAITPAPKPSQQVVAMQKNQDKTVNQSMKDSPESIKTLSLAVK